MTKKPSALPILSMRLDPELKRQLEQRASRDARTLTSLVTKILSDWLRSQQIKEDLYGKRRAS